MSIYDPYKMDSNQKTWCIIVIVIAIAVTVVKLAKFYAMYSC